MGAPDHLLPSSGKFHRTVRLTDALIAATGVVHGLPVVTQDADFDQVALAHPALQVLRV
ncbi:PIN domain-containing protein [Micropruina sp.]|uniref:PIN domain-containing protein n=1 Tax=Micropruina sp. TaxID=2737536 RepID=UPI0039E36AF1